MRLLKIICLTAALVFFSLSVSFAKTADPLASAKTRLNEVFNVLKEYSLYSPSDEELAETMDCMLMKAFLTLKEMIMLTEYQGFDLFSTCFHKDLYTHYKPQSREDTSLFDAKKLIDTAVEARILTPEIGYLKIHAFMHIDPETGEDILINRFVEPALEAFAKRGITKLILDLLDNPGGFLADMYEFLNFFSPENNTPMIIIQQRDNSSSVIRTESRGTYAHWKIAILMNRESASAAELTAGVLRYWGIATIIGEKSYGKWVGQAIYPLQKGGTLTFTTARIFLPDGITFDGIGMEPDISVSSFDSLKKARNFLQGKKFIPDDILKNYLTTP